VVGVNVAGLIGTRINMAIPGEYVHLIVNGRLAHQRIGQSYKSQARVNVPITFELINPLDRVQKVEVELWTGEDTPRYEPPGGRDTAPAPRQGDSKHERFLFDLRKDKTTGAETARGYITLPDLPPGKAYWWQPVITVQDKEKKSFVQWLRGEKYALEDDPADRRPVKLANKNAPGKRKVTLSIKQRFEVPTLKEEADHEVTVELIAELIEQVSAPDQQGRSVITINVEKADKLIHIPEKLLEEKKDRELDAQEVRALQSTSFLDLTLVVDRNGQIERAETTAKNVPADTKAAVEELGHQFLDALQALHVKLPGRQLAHLEPWKADKPSPIPIPLPIGSVSAPMKLDYEYLGVRSHDGHEEGLVELVGTFRQKGRMSQQVGGRIEGRALVDVNSGLVKKAKGNVNLFVKINLGGRQAEMRGKMDILLVRELMN
jgi:hypothetical protein